MQGTSCPPTHPGEDGKNYFGPCSICKNKDAPIAQRLENGDLVCKICAYPPEECHTCKQVRIVSRRIDLDGNPCRGTGLAQCYECSAVPERCFFCTRVRPIFKRIGGVKGEGPVSASHVRQFRTKRSVDGVAMSGESPKAFAKKASLAKMGFPAVSPATNLRSILGNRSFRLTSISSGSRGIPRSRFFRSNRSLTGSFFWITVIESQQFQTKIDS